MYGDGTMTEMLVEFFTNPWTIVFLVLIVVGMILTTVRRIQSRQAWEELTLRTGLQRAPTHRGLLDRLLGYRSEQQLSGFYRGRRIELSQATLTRYVREGGERERRSTTATTVRVPLDVPPPGRLSLQRSLTLGKQPLPEICDRESLERLFLVRSDPPQLVDVAIASQEVCRKLLGLRGSGRLFLMAVGEQAWLTYEKTSRVRAPDLLQEVMDLLLEMAQSIERYARSVV